MIAGLDRGAQSGGDVAAAQQRGVGEQGRGGVVGQHERGRRLPEQAGAAWEAGGGGGQAAKAVHLDDGAEVGDEAEQRFGYVDQGKGGDDGGGAGAGDCGGDVPLG